jgi:uncharacterized DUF497 family protein
VEFEWDADKELANIQKHQATFAEAVETFLDERGNPTRRSKTFGA